MKWKFFACPKLNMQVRSQLLWLVVEEKKFDVFNLNLWHEEYIWSIEL